MWERRESRSRGQFRPRCGKYADGVSHREAQPWRMSTLTLVRKPGYAALRKGRVSSSGQIYLVTFTTINRQRLFEKHDVARIACNAMSDPRLWLSSGCLAWVLMPDHWHGLIELGDEVGLSSIVQKLKTNTARRVRQACPGTRVVWKKGFHDRALRAEESLEGVARYIVCNPVRAGLVERVGDYPYWNAVWI